MKNAMVIANLAIVTVTVTNANSVIAIATMTMRTAIATVIAIVTAMICSSKLNVPHAVK